jgi:nitrous oxidase accessory protein NosD
VTDVERETVRLQNEVSKVISTIELSSGDRTMTMLNEQMEKLKSVGNITTPTEGVVFIYKGNAYKFTGNFFAINQVLGLFRQRS